MKFKLHTLYKKSSEARTAIFVAILLSWPITVFNGNLNASRINDPRPHLTEVNSVLGGLFLFFARAISL